MWPSQHRVEALYRSASQSLIDALRNKGIHIQQNGEGILVTGNYQRYKQNWYETNEGLVHRFQRFAIMFLRRPICLW